MKCIVFLEFVETDMAKIALKLQKYEEAKKKNPAKYPDAIFPAHLMYEGLKGFAIWEGTEEQVTNKVAYELPEVQCTVVPIIDGRAFLKSYMEIKK